LNKDDKKADSVWQRLGKLKKNKNFIYAVCAAGLAGTVTATYQTPTIRQSAALLFSDDKISIAPVKSSEIKWGFALDNYHVFEDEFRSGEILGEILLKQGITNQEIAALVTSAKGVFDITSLRIGKKYTFLSPVVGGKPEYMVYEPSPYQYAVFHLGANPHVEIVKREVQTEIVASSGILESSFWQALTDNGLNDELADGMIDVLAHYVDFYHQKQGDKFKIVYEKHLVEGKEVGTGKILAALYEREGKQFYAFNYDKKGESCKYFDIDARPAKKAFLKSPVKFSRISSRYSLNRMHPILGYSRPHFGTDYAAPQGTPILAIADGIIEEATRRGGNGNFVKMRHDGTYESQYLHMSGFAKGMRPGAHVAQGQVIGYVGSTGLATGPHCCFRFWKNGKQVDHTRLDLPTAQPMKGEDLANFNKERDRLQLMLNQVEYHTQEEIYQAKTAETGKVNP
jgi:murein DD-endopeptidase MepM/ murein hydrolase activator NlpD